MPYGGPSGAMVVNRAMRVVAWSDTLADITGVTSAEAVGNRCWEVLCARDGNGEMICDSDCPLAHIGLAGRSVPTLEISVPRQPDQPVTLSTITARTREGTVLVHLLKRGRGAGDAAARGLLSERQQQTLELLAAGQGTAQIAAALGVSTNTARNHIAILMRKLDAHSRLEAIVAARRQGLLP